MDKTTPHEKCLPGHRGFERTVASQQAVRLPSGVVTLICANLLLLSGCGLQQWVQNGFKVGPNYGRPPAPVASEWIDYKDKRVKSEEQQLSEWWRVFDDPSLDGLMETAYRQNISLRVAGARIMEARAERGIAVGNLFPQRQEMFGEHSRNKVPNTTAQPFTEQWFQNWNGGFGASWELDFWGRYRRSIEAADAELDASIENYDDVLVILFADVASSYVQLRTSQERLRLAWRSVVGQYNAYHLAADKFILGATTERDVQQAKQILEQTRASIPQFEIDIRRANNQICILLGIPPRELAELEVGTFEAELQPLKLLLGTRIDKIADMVKEYAKERQRPAEDMPGLLEPKDANTAKLLKPLDKDDADKRRRIPFAKPDVVVAGVPADLIRRRPDIRRAERQVAAQSARIGVAVSELYPHFSLNGSIGLAAEQFGDLWQTPGSMFGFIGPSFRWNILNYGRLTNNIRVQDARFQEFTFAYENAVLQAGRDVENAIVGYLKSHDQTDRLFASEQAADRTLVITREQYRLGAVDFTPVVLFESTLADQQDQHAIARGNIALNLIAAYRALGGGWEMRVARDQQSAMPAVPAAIPEAAPKAP